MYNAIKNQQILQPLSSVPVRSSTSSLSPGPTTMLRNRSLRGQSDRLTTLKRGSIRGLQSILGGQGTSPYSSNSSIDGRVSPSPSFTASTHDVGLLSCFFVLVAYLELSVLGYAWLELVVPRSDPWVRVESIAHDHS